MLGTDRQAAVAAIIVGSLTTLGLALVVAACFNKDIAAQAMAPIAAIVGALATALSTPRTGKQEESQDGQTK